MSGLDLTGKQWSQAPCLLAVAAPIDYLNRFNRLESQWEALTHPKQMMETKKGY